jgi:hypothetical protein
MQAPSATAKAASKRVVNKQTPMSGVASPISKSGLVPGSGALVDLHGSIAVEQPGATEVPDLPLQTASSNRDLPNSAGALFHGQLQNKPHNAAGGVAVTSDGLSYTFMRKSSKKPGDTADAASPDSTKAAEAPHNPKDPTGDDQQKTGKTAPLPIFGQPLVSVILPASSVLPVLKLAPQRIAIAAQPNTQTGPLGTRLTEGEDAFSQMAVVPGSPAATHPADGVETGDTNQAESSSAGTIPLDAIGVSREPVAAFAENGGLSATSASGAPHSAPAPHANHAIPEQVPAGASAAAASLGAQTAIHLTDVPVPVPPHGEQSASIAIGNAAVSDASGVGPNLYDRIDQGAAPVVLHSGAQHVSVGVHDADLGWVEIQTQSAAGHVEATLVTASALSHDSLAAQLPAMAQYLEQHDVKVGTLTVHHEMPGSNAGGGLSGGTGFSSGNNGAGAHHSGSGNPGGERAAPRYSGISPVSLRAPGIEGGARAGEESTAFQPLSYISVRA